LNRGYVTLATKRRIEVCPTDDDLLVMRTRMPIGKDARRPIRAPTAKCRELLHRVGKRNTVEKVALEWTAVGVSVESYKVEVPLVRIYHPLHKGNKVLEKLGFVHNDDLETKDVLQSNVIQVPNSKARSPLVVMCSDLVCAVPCIVGMLDDEDGRIHCRITRNNTQNP
jgi:hypothetical protein